MKQKYQRFSDANHQATDLLVPQKKRNRKTSHSKHPEVMQARQDMSEALKKYRTHETDENPDQLREAMEMLYSTYDRLKAQDIREKMGHIQNGQGPGKYKETRKVSNEITGKKKAKEGLIPGANPEERVKPGSLTSRNSLEKDHKQRQRGHITPVFEEIKAGPFTTAKYQKAKNALKQGKATGPDGIPPKVGRTVL